MKNNNARVAIILITSLFFMWGFALNLNPILIPHLKKACQLTDLQSALIDSASYFAYFFLAIPAGQVMKRFGYKGGIILGLSLFALGAFLFYPAAETRIYAFFLAALFIIASGLTFLETAANPYITVLGDEANAATRLNFAQSFNGLAAALAAYLGGRVILSGKTLSKEEEFGMGPEQLDAYLNNEAASVKLPFIVIGLVVLFVAILLWRTKLPEINDEGETKEGGFKSLFKEKNLMLGVLAQFFYVGAQACIGSFFIRFAGKVAGIGELAASTLLSTALVGFMAGRFIGTFMMKFIAPARLLAIYAVLNMALLTLAIMLKGDVAVYALIAVPFFMSIMFPTIFALGIKGLGSKTKEGSSLIIMAIVGGAIFPLIMGLVSDLTNIQISYAIPASCFSVVFYFALKNIKVKEVTLSATH